MMVLFAFIAGLDVVNDNEAVVLLAIFLYVYTR
jgi:hypothetical protein